MYLVMFALLWKFFCKNRYSNSSNLCVFLEGTFKRLFGQFWQPFCVLDWWNEDEKLIVRSVCALLTLFVCLLSLLPFFMTCTNLLKPNSPSESILWPTAEKKSTKVEGARQTWKTRVTGAHRQPKFDQRPTVSLVCLGLNALSHC